MPKMKSCRAARKRFKVSASGKVRREHAYANHKFTSKTAGRKRRLRKGTVVAATEARRVHRLILS